MAQPVGRITQLRLYPIRPFWSLGSGWAAVGGGLAAGGFALTPGTLLNLLLVWLLADPILGVMWDLGTGHIPPSGGRGIWRQLLAPQLPDAAPPVRFLPYLQPGSPGYRLAERLGRLAHWWQTSFQPQAAGDFATIVAALGLALVAGIILGPAVLALVLASVLLSWLAVLSEGRGHGQDMDRASLGEFWHALGEFGVPWAIGAVVAGELSWPVALLGTCYVIAYFGFLRPERYFRLIAGSQVTASLLLAALRHPLAAGAATILLLPQWGLHTWYTYLNGRAGAHHADSVTGRGMQPFIILSLFVAALAIAS